MKMPTGTITCCVIAAALAGCADGVAAPTVPEVAAPSAGAASLAMAESNGATQESGLGLFVNDYSEYFDCLGETVHMHIEVPFHWSLKTTPSGNEVYFEPFVQHEGSASAEGLTSGRVWTATDFVGPLKFATTGAEALSYVLIIDWASPTGPSWALHDTLHFTITPDGELAANRFDSRCVLKGPPA